MRVCRKAGRLITSLLLCALIAAFVIGCGDSEIGGIPSGSVDSFASKGRNVLSPRLLAMGLRAGHGTWADDAVVIGKPSGEVESELAVFGGLPDEYGVSIEAVASEGPVTIYAPAYDNDALIPLRILVLKSSTEKLPTVPPDEPFQVSIRVWKKHLLAKVNDQPVIAHAGDVNEHCVRTEPLTHARAPLALSIKRGNLRVTRLMVHDIADEKPEFEPMTRTDGATLGDQWPKGREYWVARPNQTSSVEWPWGECDIEYEQLDDGIRLHATKIKGDHAKLLHRGLLSGDFRWVLRYRREPSSNPSSNVQDGLTIGFVSSTGGMRFRNTHIEPRGGKFGEHELDISRSGREVKLRLDGKSIKTPTSWSTLNGDLYFVIRLQTGMRLRLIDLRVKCAGGLKTPIPAE